MTDEGRESFLAGQYYLANVLNLVSLGSTRGGCLTPLRYLCGKGVKTFSTGQTYFSVGVIRLSSTAKRVRFVDALLINVSCRVLRASPIPARERESQTIFWEAVPARHRLY